MRGREAVTQRRARAAMTAVVFNSTLPGSRERAAALIVLADEIRQMEARLKTQRLDRRDAAWNARMLDEQTDVD